MQAGEIIIKLEGVPFEETKRLSEIVHTLIANGSLNIKGGRATLHFDGTGTLMKIDHDFCKWYRKKN